jgi:lia operon protein LiaG
MATNALRTLGVLLATAPAPLLLPQHTVAQATGTYTLNGETVAIYNLAGAVDIMGGNTSGVRVEVQAGGADANELVVETGPIRGAETLRIIYPSDRVSYRGQNGFNGNTEMTVRDDGTFSDEHRGRWSGGRRIRISSRGSGLDAHADLRIAVPVGQRVNVYLGVGELTVDNVNGNLLVHTGSGRVRSTRTKGQLSIDTGSGSVDVRDAEGDVRLDTGSGSVDVTNVRGQRLSIDTGSGSVSGSSIEVHSLDVDTGSGGITLGALSTDDALLDTGSGSVSLDLVRDIDNLKIDTGSGGVTITHPRDLGAELYLESGSGGIDFDTPVTVRRFNRSSLTGSIGDGRGRIDIDTGSGSIRFRVR